MGVCLVLVGAAVCVQPECFPTADQRLVKTVLAAIEVRRSDAYDLAQEYLKRPESGSFGIALAADAAALNFENDAAIEHYRKLPKDGGKWEFLAEMGLARRCEVTGLLTDEERHLRRALELFPHHVEASSRLSHILQVAGRNWEGISPFFDQILRGKCRGDELLGLAAPERFFRADEHLEELGLAANPPEIMIRLADARRAIYENRQAEAEKLLREVIHVMPQLGEAQGRLGRIIYDRGDEAEFLQWRGQLPSDAQNHPEVWFVQGLQARRLGLIEGATRCFLETLYLSPNHLAANVQIAGCLDQQKRSELAKEFVQRGEKLANLETTLYLLRKDVDPELMKRVITTCGEMGRFWEAAGWTYVMTHLPAVSSARTHQDLKYWLNKAQHDPDQVSRQFNLTARLRRSDFREPRWGASVVSGNFSDQRRGNNGLSGVIDEIPWSFQEEAERVGISFNYFEGTTEETRLQHIFNVVGGGVAAIDYDQDGLCDVYLTQANNWRDPAPQPNYTDRLFRNVDGHFVDVTVLAGTEELSFSHGVTAGDFDQDGFSDLYIGNLGPNRLYRNNGDGTFSDFSAGSGVAGNEWTTSSVFADFSGDGLPDLYVANYSVIEETAKKECKDKSGVQMACTPDMLTAEFHRLYLNEGDGRFRDITLESGMRIPNGRGLGLVAWDFGGDGRLGLFVANDTSPNFLFINAGTGHDGVPKFREEGAIRGVAFDADGNAQACMGVAAGDANGDGQLDMYITNFFGESDTLYMQKADGFFDDATRPFTLRDAGFWTLGFGCQFADLDGDGWDDLISTNGHVDQRSSRGDEDRMPPQVFRNLRGRRFEEIPGTKLGPFFQKGYLGRGLATLDWNRDGKTDVAISHLHSPFALVTNRTSTTSIPFVVKLVGRTGAREPTGAVVRVQTDSRVMFRLQTAGDGYLSTNERRLAFAIPKGERISQIDVKWPSGTMQHWGVVSAGQEVLLIEGRETPIFLFQFHDDNQ